MAAKDKKPVAGFATSSPWKGFGFSCIACCVAESVTIPIDVVKTRLQLQGELGANRMYNGAFDAARKMYVTEGLKSWYKGITPALLRQATYGSLRYGLYEPIKTAFGVRRGEYCPLWKKILAGTLSGALSSSLCNPTDLVKVRMQADMGATPRYRNTFSAFSDIVRTEGVLGLYRGVGPTCGRAAVGAATELAAYDEIKGFLVNSGMISGGAASHFASALFAGFISTLANSPFDVVRSRVMNQPVHSAPFDDPAQYHFLPISHTLHPLNR